MTLLTRRTALAGTAAVAAAAVTSGLRDAVAAAPPAGKQAPSVYRYKIGSFEVTAVSDGGRVVPLADNFVRNAKKDEVNTALEAAFLEKDKFPFVFTPLVVNTGKQLVVIDTGNGRGALQQSGGTAGQFHDNLAAAGIDPKTVDAVIISHFHGDHIGGLLDAGNKLAFPNAEVLVPAPEWAFWMDDGNMNRAPEAARGGFANARRVFDAFGRKATQYEAGKEVVPGITAVGTPGHTPGHMSHLVADGNASVMVQGDVSNLPALFVRNPGWHAMFDMDPQMAEASRRKLYDQVVADRTLLQGYHFPFPAHGHLEKDGQGYRLVPAQWSTVL